MAIKMLEQHEETLPTPNAGRRQLFFDESGVLRSMDTGRVVSPICSHADSGGADMHVVPIVRKRLAQYMVPISTPVPLSLLGWYMFEFKLLVTVELATSTTVGFSVVYPDDGDGLYGHTATLVRDMVGTTTYRTSTERGKIMADGEPRKTGGPFLTTITGSLQATADSPSGLGLSLCGSASEGVVTVDGVGRITRLN